MLDHGASFVFAGQVSPSVRAMSRRKLMCCAFETVHVGGRSVRLLTYRRRSTDIGSAGFRRELERLELLADRSTILGDSTSAVDVVVGGCDEAGAGCLAGPVVASAVVLPRRILFEGLNDSKMLSARKREDVYRGLLECAEVHVGVSIVDENTIDSINIRNARLLAMERAVTELCKEITPRLLLVDGNMTLDGCAAMPVERQMAIIGGDAMHDVIAASSIVAKVTRDGIMEQLHEQYPQYQFDRHKGYATAVHLAALAQHGPCPAHRRSFAPVQKNTRAS